MRRRRADPKLAQRDRNSAALRHANDPEYLPNARQRRNVPHLRAWAIRRTDKWRIANPEKSTAHNAVAKALLEYRLVRGPCAGCGTNKFVCAYHDDYTKPLKVKWNCRHCHHVARLAQATTQVISVESGDM
jgi:hypothetical protein